MKHFGDAKKDKDSSDEQVKEKLTQLESIFSQDTATAIKLAGDICSLIDTLSDAENKCKHILTIAKFYSHIGMYNESLEQIQKAKRIKEELNVNDFDYGLILLREANNLMQLGNYHDVLQLLECARDIFASFNDNEYIAETNLSIVRYYDGIQEFSKALETLYNTEEIAAKLRNKSLRNRVLISFGNVYSSSHDHSKAAKYFIKSAKYAKSEGNLMGYAASLSNLCKEYTLMRFHKRALSNAKKVLAIYQQINNPGQIARMYLNIGMIYNECKQHNEALAYLTKALHLQDKLNNPVGVASILLNLANTYLNLKKLNKASMYVKQAIVAAKDIEATELLAPCYQLVYFIERNRKNWKNALEYYIKYNDMLNIIWNKEKETQILNLEHDFDRIKQAQEAEIFKLKNVELKKRNKQIIEQKNTLEKTLADLKTANQTKNKLFSIIAHDLRGPIGALMQGLELLADPSYSVTDKKQLLIDLTDSITKVYAMTDNLLVWASKQMEMIVNLPRPTNIGSLINSVIEQHHHLLNAKKISVDAKINSTYNANVDQNIFSAVFRNLFSNAIKFSPHKGNIYIYVREINDHYICSITDSGSGIPPENAAKLFDANRDFITSGSSNEKGIGLGLMICKELVQLMGGDITISSEIGKGSTFSFAIPK